MGFLFDGITALSAVVGVIVAVYLGLRAIRLASRTVDRSALDYAATRADLATHWRITMSERMADFKAALHVFWKEDPQLLLRVDPGSERAMELLADRKLAEVEAHKCIYLLDSGAARLKEALPSVQVEMTAEGKTVQVGGAGQERAAALAEIYARSAMPLYFALVPEESSFTDPKVDPESFSGEFVDYLRRSDDGASIEAVIAEADSWLKLQLKGDPDSQRTAEIISINFIEHFMEKQLTEAVREIVDDVLQSCRARTGLVSAS